jgi:DNA-binding NtrC family response regulator
MNQNNSPQPVILCVDDDITILQSLRILLRNSFGDAYFYELAESPDEAREILTDLDLENVPVLAIITDWIMPEMKGDEFLIEVHQKYPHIIKIMLTGQADQEAIERAQKSANLYAFFPKPWDENELIETLKSAINLGNRNG